MTFKLYDCLEVEKSASKEEIKKAYKKKAIQCHPDKGGDPEVFKEVSRAYQVLNDDEKRKIYDQVGDERFQDNLQEGPAFDPRDLFSQFFNGHGGGGGGGGGGFEGFEFPFGHPGHGGQGGQRRSQKCGDHRHVWQISLRDAFFGIEKTIKVSVNVPCRSCVETCYACQGKGSITQMHRMGMFTQMTTRQCEVCNGQGRALQGKTTCGNCKGKAHINQEHRLEIKAPKGVQTGHHIRVPRLGEQSMERDDLSGDLIIEVIIQAHPLFRRDGNDLHAEIPITFAQCITGMKISIPHFERELEIQTLDFGVIQPNRRYLIPRHGMPGGNLLLQFNIEYPKNKIENKSALEELQRIFTTLGWC